MQDQAKTPSPARPQRLRTILGLIVAALALQTLWVVVLWTWPRVDQPLLDAALHDTGRLVRSPPALDERRATYERACREGDPLGCSLQAARMLPLRDWHGLDVGRMGRACMLGRMADCVVVARVLSRSGPVAEVDRTLPHARLAYFAARLACKARLASGCQQLAEFHLAGPPAETIRAEAYARESCAASDPGGCLALARSIAASSPQDASKITSDTCASGLLGACESIARAHADGGDLPTALKLYDTTCENGSTRACLEAGQIYLREGTPVASTENARARLQRACDGFELVGCTLVASLTEEGRGVLRDVRAASARYRELCDDDEPLACERLARIVRSSRLGNADPAAAGALFRKSCDLKPGAACHELAAHHAAGEGVEKNDATATALYGRACEAKDLSACRLFGEALEEGVGIARSAGRAAEAYAKACGPTDREACLRLALLLNANAPGLPADPARAFNLLDDACNAGIKPACHEWANAFRKGLGAAIDVERWRELEDKTCRSGYGEACQVLAAAYATGRDVPADPEKASDYQRKACGRGELDACDALHIGHPLEILDPPCAQGRTDACALATRFHYEALADRERRICAAIAAGTEELEEEQIPWKPEQALRAFRSVCLRDPPDAMACMHYAERTRDKDEAPAFYLRACEHGAVGACLKASTFAPTFEASIDALERACLDERGRLHSLDDLCHDNAWHPDGREACLEGARRLSPAEPGPPYDQSRAVKLATQGCEFRSDGEACVLGAHLLPADAPEAELLLRRGCERAEFSHETSCLALSARLWKRGARAEAIDLLTSKSHGMGRPTGRDEGFIAVLDLRSACIEGHGAACVALSPIDPLFPDEARPWWSCGPDGSDDQAACIEGAHDSLDAACRAGSAEGCYGLALFDLGQPADSERGRHAQTLLEKACHASPESRSERACAHLTTPR